MEVILIVAIAKPNNGIGKANDLLWHLPADMKFFRSQTTGFPVITGRKNYESIPEKFRPLPHRENIVITRQDITYENTDVCSSIEDALRIAKSYKKNKAFIIGGGQIYKQCLESNLIDKHIYNSINMGKVNSILSEVRSCHEEVITIADADVFYFSNWQFKTLEVFKNFKNIGVVAPLPCTNIYSYCNMSFFSNILKPKKKGFIISKKSCELFGESVGYDEEKILRLSLWKKPQFYIKNSSDKVCLGAGHFVASYRGNLLHKVPFVKNKFVFKNGDEFNFLDRPIDVLGYYRVSLINSYAYHLGNSIPIWVRKIKLHQNDIDIFTDFKFKKNKIIQLPYSLRVIISSLWHKLNKI